MFAQQWDLETLTEQRDKVLEENGGLVRQHEAARAELATLRTQMRSRRASAEVGEQTASARAGAAVAMARATIEVAAELARLHQESEQTGDGAASLSASVVSEAMLLQASGTFDHDFYVAQLETGLTLAEALLHYIVAGEAAGHRPNPLFDLTYYLLEVARTNAPDTARFTSRLAHYVAVGCRLGLRPSPLVDHAFCCAQIDQSEHPGFEPVSYYLQVGRFVGFTTHPLIDKMHYLRVRGGLGVDADPLADYRLIGAEQGYSLHPLFDAGWYGSNNPDVSEAGWDALDHYLAFGDAEGRWPNPLFDPSTYRANATVPSGMPALTHYVRQGGAGARTHFLFDGVWYLRKNPDVQAIGMDPLEHYLGSGAREGRTPHPLFDTAHLFNKYPGLAVRHINPVLAFLRSDACQRGSPHPLFDAHHYILQVPEAADYAAGAFAHFMVEGADNDADPHPLFCTRYYREQLARAPGAANAEPNALLHFLAAEGGAGCQPHPLFDPDFYLDNHQDVRGNGISPLVHFIESGGTRGEHRQPHRLFDISFYADQLARQKVADVTDASNLLLDYLRDWRDRPAPHPLFDGGYYLAQTADALCHPNPLVDYAWKGRAARRAPHRLFDPDFYVDRIAMPAAWTRTLLEHYVAKQTAETFLPHPALDGDHVAALIGADPDRNPSLLEMLVSPAVDGAVDGDGTQHELSPHAGFSSRDYRLLHPEIGPAVTPFTAFLESGGGMTPAGGWGVRGEADRWDLAYEARKIALCGTGGLAPVSPHAARGRMLRHRMSGREVDDSRIRVAGSLAAGSLAAGSLASGSLAAGRLTPGGARLAIYAASLSPEAEPLHLHALTALAKAGFAILLVDAAPPRGVEQAADLAARPAPSAALRRLAQATITHSMGNQHIGSFVLACRQFAAEIAKFGQVLFLSDNLLGPIGPADDMLRHLAAATTGWWGVTHADQWSGAVDSECFALSGALIASAPFSDFIAAYRFADAGCRVVETAEQELSRMLRASGAVPTLLAPAADLRATWLHELPAKRRWFRDLLETQTETNLTTRIATYADLWLRAGVQSPDFGGRIRPGLLFWDALIQHHHLPFLRRDLLTINPIDDPAILRLRDILGAERHELLQRLLVGTLPHPESMAHPPVLRLGLAPATEMTLVRVTPVTPPTMSALAPRARRAVPESAA